MLWLLPVVTGCLDITFIMGKKNKKGMFSH